MKPIDRNEVLFVASIFVSAVALGLCISSVVARVAIEKIEQASILKMQTMGIPSDAITIIHQGGEGILQKYMILSIVSGSIASLSAASAIYFSRKVGDGKRKYLLLAIMLLGISIIAGTELTKHLLDKENMVSNIDQQLMDHYSFLPIDKSILKKKIEEMTAPYAESFFDAFHQFNQLNFIIGGGVCGIGFVALMITYLRKKRELAKASSPPTVI